MTSRTLAGFWQLYKVLPRHVRHRARRAYSLFEADPFDPTLRFKPLRKYPGYRSIRIGLGYRAVCKVEGDTVYWFWIGSHADFDRDFD